MRDPWGLLLGVTAAGAAWAVNVNPLGAAAVGAAVWVAKAFTAAWQATAPELAPEAKAPPVTKGSPEEAWLLRAQHAASTFADLTASMRGQILLDRVASMRPQVDDMLTTLRGLAGQASITGTALSRFDPSFLHYELTRLTHARTTATPETTSDLDRSIASITAQQEVLSRLTATRTQALSRLESGTINLEALLARAVELSTMTTNSSTPTTPLDDLTTELELTRQSLHEIEQATRQDLQ